MFQDMRTCLKMSSTWRLLSCLPAADSRSSSSASVPSCKQQQQQQQQ
jgi:hypothetical protein